MSDFGTKDWLIEVAKGNVPGHSIIHKFGRNVAVGTTFVPVAFGGLYNTPQPAAATTLRVKAGNANDTAAGTGAREITLLGLDETATEVSEAVATAGASASAATTTTFMRTPRAFVSASGTYATALAGSHAADIVIENGAGGTDWLTIDSTSFPKGQTEIAVYSVPTGFKAYVLSALVVTDVTKTTDVLLFKRESILDAAAPYSAMRLLFEGQLKGAPLNFSPRSPMLVTGPCDVGWMAKVTSGSAEVAVDFEILQVAD